MSDEVSSIQNADGSVSSKRVMGIFFTCFLALGGLIVLLLAVGTKADNQWVYLAGFGVVGLSVVFGLVMFGYIKATDIAEIAKEVKGGS